MGRIFRYIKDVFTHTFSYNEYSGIHVKRIAAVQIIVATIAFILMMRVFPAEIVQKHTMSRQKGYRAADGGEVFTHDEKKLQTVYFKGGHIYRIKLYMQCTVDGGMTEDSERLAFCLYNSDFSCIYKMEADSRSIQSIARHGYLTALPDTDVEADVPYYYEILVGEDSRNEYRLPAVQRQALGQTENGALFINGIINDEVSLVADFEYTAPLSLAGKAVRYVLTAAGAVLAYTLLLFLLRLYDEYKPQDVGKYVRAGLASASVLASSALTVYAVILNKFGGELWDRLFFLAGIVVAQAWFIVALWRMTRVIRAKKSSQMTVSGQICLIWRNYIQTVSFGLLFYALCQYVNADRNFFQYTNTRWMLIFLAVALLMNYNEKQLINKFSIIWLLLAAVGSALYCSENLNEGIAANIINGKEAKAWESALLLARLNCGIVTAWGLLVINIIRNLVQQGTDNIKAFIQRFHEKELQMKIQQVFYVVLWVLFGILMYIYRFEKAWVFTATLPFATFIFAKSTPASKARFLKNFTNGILLSFAFVTLFCLQHRPHHYWMLYRYGGIFHTVACTGMYLAVVFGAALAKLYGRLKLRRSMLLFCYTEYFMTACVAGFILLTMSRTAFLTTFVTILAIVVLTAAVYHKGIRRILSELGVLAAVCVVSFPMVFTSVRMIPAVVNDPVRYEIEFDDTSFMICEGDPIDSDKYMTVRRFFYTLFGRFQTQSDDEEGLAASEAGALAWTGDGLAGIGVQTAVNSDDASGGDDEEEEDKDDISNGRFKIFKDYIKVIGLEGHPKMGPENENGGEYGHAHNSYLQVAYNFGMIAGVVFLVLCAMTLWRSVRLYMEYGRKYNIFLVPFALVIVFGFISLTEWAFHPCIPAGFCFILMQVFLMRTDAN